jgi:hypothetical protein
LEVEGIGVIVSLLETGEVEELGLQREAGLCHDLDMEFGRWRAGVNAPGDGPRRGDSCASERGESRCRALPCRDRRSSLIAACVLVLLGLAPGMAFDLIGKARGVKVPDTEGQRDRVDMFREATKTGGIHPA